VAWQTGSDNIGIFPRVVNNPEKFGIMRDTLYGVNPAVLLPETSVLILILVFLFGNAGYSKCLL